MSDTPAAAAKTALSAHLRAALGGIMSVTDGTPDRLSAAPNVIVDAVDATWQPHRWLVGVEVTVLVRVRKPGEADASLTDVADAVMAAMPAMRAATPVHWLGPGSELTWTAGDSVTVDGSRYAGGSVAATLAVPRAEPRAVGESEQAVRDVLAAAGIAAVDAADVPPFVVTRWGGSAADDPHYDDIVVQVAAEVESGDIEQLARRVWDVLYRSDAVVVLDTVDVDHRGQPYGSDGIYETAEMLVRTLNPRTGDG